MITGDKYLNFTGNMTIIDHINKIELLVTYNPPKAEGGGMFKSLKSKLWGGAKKGE
jgi:hypothetical protein